MKSLIIVESPAKCNKIEEYAGPGYICVASFGHLRELINIKNIDFNNNCKPSFTIINSKEKQVSTIKKLINKCDDVILATDDDREGEAIAWHICDIFKLNLTTTKRIIFHEITKPAIQNALKKHTIVDMNKVYAQQSRQILDLIVGYRISPILWKHITRNSSKGLSAGRCQTPALKLVFDNYNDIKMSPGTKVFTTTGYFTKLNLPYELSIKINDDDKINDFLTDSVNHDHIYSFNKPTNTIKKPPIPFTTSGLQQSASNILHISPKETMKLCQELYEGGYITYMRTDSKAYSKEFIEKTKDYIKNKWDENYINENIDKLSNEKDNTTVEKPVVEKQEKKKKTKKEKEKKDNAQEAHESIRPTSINRENIDDEISFSPRKKKLYKIIWENTIESCMANAQCLSLKTTITTPLKEVNYKYNCEQITFPGWKIIKGYEKEEKSFNYLQQLKNKSIINYKKIISKETLKDLKQHYTEAKLVQLLEDKGIGRPSTFSSLVDKIQERGYVKKEDITGKKIMCCEYELIDNEITVDSKERVFGNEKNKLVIQSLGIMVIEFLINRFDNLFNYDYTKNMEEQLDVISKGESTWYDLCYSCNDMIDELSKGLDNTQESIRIDENHTYMIAKHGPVIKYTCDDVTTFKNVKKDLDINKIKSKDYSLEDMLEENNNNLGIYENEEMIIKKGKFGLYVTWGNNKLSLNGIDKSIGEITLEDVKSFMTTTKKNTSAIRDITKELSIRTGKYGLYLFYKTEKMTKPRFLNIKDYKGDIKEDTKEKILSWVKEKYNINLQ